MKCNPTTKSLVFSGCRTIRPGIFINSVKKERSVNNIDLAMAILNAIFGEDIEEECKVEIKNKGIRITVSNSVSLDGLANNLSDEVKKELEARKFQLGFRESYMQLIVPAPQ